MKVLISLCVCIFVVFAEAAIENNNKGKTLIWADEFNTLNRSKWTHVVSAWGGGNGEFQYYRDNRKNSFVKDGKLFIRPTPTVDEVFNLENSKIEEPGCNQEPCISVSGTDVVSPYFSARLTTKDKFSFNYGRVEIRAKIPTGDWMWPAFWLLPEKEVYGEWPKSGDMDIFEFRTNPDLRSPDGVNHGNTEVGSYVHFGPAWNNKASLTGFKQAPTGKSWSDDFHIFQLLWTNKTMKFTVDDQVINEIIIPDGGFNQLGNFTFYKGKNRDVPFDQKFYFILNVAVGGNFFPDNWTSGGRKRPWGAGLDPKRQFWNSRSTWIHTWGKSPNDQALQVDYIRVYQS